MPAQPRKSTPRKPATAAKEGPTPRRPRSTPAAVSQPVATPTAAPADDKYAPTAWGNASDSTGPQDLEMPSGQVALVRKPGLQQLMVEGVLHGVDNLTSLVEKKHVGKGKPSRSDVINVGQALGGNPEALAEMMHIVDRVVCAVVLRPQVVMAPNDPTRRQRGVIYADSVDVTDKMFIFNWVTGASKDLESFRSESEELVGSLAVVESVEEGTE